MKKIFITFSFTILLIVRISGQVDVDIPLIVSDGTDNIPLAIGLDLTATNCIDPQLGESDLPPIPPCGCLFACFDLAPYGCPYISSMKDYRAPGNPPAYPFTGMIQHTLWWQVATPGQPLNITYNIPPGAIMRIVDNITGTLLNLGPLTGQGVATIPGSYTAFGTKAIIKMQYNCIGGFPSDPIFGISTQNLIFPQMIVGNDTTLPVTVTNIGLEDTLSITNIVSSNSHFTIAPNSLPIYLAPQDSQVFLITNTSDVIAEEGTIQFTHNGCGSPASLTVSAPAGIPPGPFFSMSTTSLLFIQDTIGVANSLPFTIFNAGGENTLYINYISSNNNYFSVYPNSFPIAIEPLSQQQFYVTYTSADTLQQGIIEIIHNAPGSPAFLNVSSVYNYAQFHMDPLGLYFSSQPMTKQVIIKNLGTSDSLIINGIVSSNNNYTVTPNSLPIYISPGTIKIFYVTLNNSPGVQTGTIEFFHNASGSPAELYVTNQLADPLSEGTIIVYSGSQYRTHLFGIDPTATDGIDQHLGEADLPPFPPPGAFESKLILPENNFAGTLSSYKDYRFGNIFISETIEYRIAYQPDLNNFIEISWILPEEMSGVLLDLAGGVVINVPIADSGSFVVPNPYVFIGLKMMIDFNMEMPAELISFNATSLDNNVTLDWSTATETNNSGFEINRKKLEARSQELEWEMIGFVPGFGTTTEPKSYSFIDENVTNGIYKYRLKQIDFDGSFEYLPIGQAGSNEIEVEVDFTPKEFVLYQNYPNPFNPNTVIRFEIPGQARNDNVLVTLKIYDILGNEVATLVNEEKQAGVYEVEFDASSLASGMYLYKLQAGGFVQTKKMILLR
jgi:hypothetical protein